MEHNNKTRTLSDTIMQRVLNLFECSYDITTDSRKVKQGSIFVALKGNNVDGNHFAKQAIENGAKLAIIDDEEFYLGDKTLLVEDSLLFLQEFANYYRKTFSIPFIAISGTNGKTTTKELINAVLSVKYKVCATQGNLNNHIGVPLTLLQLKRDTQIAVIEMGASHIGDIDELCNIAEPTYGLLTNVGTAHIEGFGSLNGVLQTKTELYRYLNKTNGKVFVNFDDENLRKQDVENRISYSLYDKADTQAEIINPQDVFAQIRVDGVDIKSNLVGSYNAHNILATLTVGRYFGIPLEEIKKAIEDYKPQNHRSEIEKTEKNTLILDCYNANPSSCKFAIEAFKNISSPNKRIYIGAMKELGQVSEQEHKAIADIIKQMNLTEAIFVGEEYKEYAKGDNIHWFLTSQEAKKFVKQENITSSCILIKGSRATQMEILKDVL
ncbi:MAG: UDP-N-acetylmuramoyl-tripeptide--D-alanyl-D-alanine ligase [Bacteroidales bacterium]|nr:UDP-N-acetylmuramoyl-tripeptide--D-alanyl-D-alanine ligase [Bacteroidales bacterium]